jgi:hypothetical protein
MTGTLAQESGRAQVLRVNAALRAWAASLRELSVATREGSADLRLRSSATRRRAEELTLAFADRGAVREVLPVLDDLPVPSDEVKLDELVEILTRHHGMAACDAIIGVAVEMERAGFPPYVDGVHGGEALDMVRRVVDGYGHGHR